MPGSMQDYALKIEGIKGESRTEATKDWIDVESWSFGITQAGTFGSGHSGGGMGKAEFQDIQFRSRMSCASPKLMDACATGKHIPKAVLSCRKAGGKQEVFYTLTLTDVLVSSYQTGYSGQTTADVKSLFDEYSLNFAKIEVAYGQQDGKGAMGATVKSGWDLRKNVVV